MPCDTYTAPNQTLTERKTEVARTIEALARALASGQAKAVVGPEGGITFTGAFIDGGALARGRVTDACAYRRIVAAGGALARHAIAKAEALAGRTVDRQTLASGLHSHDGGQSWSRH